MAYSSGSGSSFKSTHTIVNRCCPLRFPRRTISSGFLGLLAAFGLVLAAKGQSWTNLIHRYSFTSGAEDSVGAANGVLLNGAVITNGAVTLDGANDYVDLPDNLMATQTSVTFETWVTDQGSGNWARIWDFGTDTTHYFFLSLPAGGGNLRSGMNSGAGEQIVEWPGGRPSVGQQAHIVWTLDAVAQVGRLYVNGVEVGVNGVFTQIPAGIGATVNDWLGRSQFGADPYFKGAIDEFRIYDVTLSAAEVLTSFQGGPDRILSGPVYFVKHPQSQNVIEGQNVTLLADVGGTPPFSAQWFRNGSPLPGATNLNYAFVAALSNNNANFLLRATNVFTNVTFNAVSSNATLGVIADLTAPVLLRARSASTNGVDLVFSESLRTDSITNLANYSLVGPSGSVGITSATLDASGALLTLGTATLLPGSNYTVSVSGVRDVVGNLIAPASQASFAATIYVLRDIGAPTGFGTILPTNNSVAISAGGTGIGGTADQFSLAYQSRTGDFDLQVRLGSLGLSDMWATAGLMARDGLATNAIFAASLATPGAAGSLFLSRATAGAGTTQAGSFPVNYPDTWLRLRRVGNVFSGYASLDGRTWAALGSVTMTASATLQVGIAVSSHNSSQTTTASAFSVGNVSFTNIANITLPFEPTGPSTRRTGLILSEIMYHPPSVASTGSLEFVEIQNTDLIAEDLTGHRLTGSIDYSFPPGTILPSGGFLVVARDPASVQSYYGISGVLGPFTNNLPNSSGTVRLRNELDGILLEVNYGSTSPWAVAADGSGHSLVLRRASYGENDPRAWAASDVIGGSPGRADSFGAEPLRGVVINEVLAHTDLPDLDAIELFNNTSQPLNLNGCVLTDDADTNKFTIGNVTIPARRVVYFTENELGFRLDAAGESLFLKNPAGTRVLDAVRFEAQENGVSIGRSRDGSEHWSRLGAKTFGSTNSTPRISQVGINEIMYSPLSGGDDLQYVELYNRGPGTVNLGGWKLMDGISYTFPSNTLITAGGYLVVANNAARLITNYANLNATNTLGNFGGNLSHGGERIALAMPDTITTTNGVIVTTNRIDIVVDEVSYNDGGRWGKWSDGGGSSLELIDPRSDRREASNWADSDETAKAPWTLIERTAVIDLGMGNGTTGNGAPNRFEFFLQGPGECLVDEMEARSNGGANLITNPGFESGSTGWIFRGTQAKSAVQAGGAYSGANSLRVIATERGDTGANRIQTAIALMPVGGANQATLRTRARWLRGDPNILLRVRGNWLECAGVMTVPANLGTPGLPNSRLAANVGPAISEVTHAPVLPAANELVVVTARVTDVDLIASLLLQYRLDPATSFTGVNMRDDGTGGDAFANDGIYSATIPGQPANTLVAFFIQAQDGSGSPVTKFFPSDAPVRECLVNFGEAPRATSLGSYRILVTQSNLTYWAAREKNSNEGLDATFIYGNSRVVYNAQTLYSGSPFHTPTYNGPLGVVCNYIVEFPKDDLFLGTTDFVLQGQATTESSTFNNDLTTQTEITAQWMARKIGLRPDYRRYVFVAFNGQARGMIYYDCQQPNNDFVEEYFSDDAEGHLHKIEDWFEFDDAGAGQSIITATLQDFEVSGLKRTERYRWTWRPRAVKGSPNEFEDLFALVDAVNATGPEPYTSATLNLVDIPQWARVFALEHMAGNWDSYGYERGKNMYTYKPEQGPWELMLWDVQLIFNKGGRSTTHSLFTIHDPVISRMLTHPRFLREYWGAFYDLVNGPMLPANYYSMMDARKAALLANGVPVQDPTSVKNWVDARRSYIASQIPQAAFSVAGPGSFSSSSNSVTLTGVAPVNAGNILINGAAYPATWTTATNWSVRVVLGAGANVLNVSAVDRAGNLISNAVVSVNYTGGVVAPEGNVVFNEIEYRPTLDGTAFVELFNTHSTYTFDLSNWRVNGLDYTFPPGAILPPRSFLVLTENTSASALAYGPTSLMFDNFNGSLDPDGETLTLFRPGGGTNEIVVDRVRYEVSAPWPVIANGASLQLVDATQDNSRVANWRLAPTNASGPQWVYVTAMGNATSSSFYLYLQSAGDVYVDDLVMVAGSVPEAGANLFTNGGFEAALAGSWSISSDFAQSVRSTSVAHSGAASLHVVATAAGSGNNDSIQQTISPALVIGQPYTLSFWYLQNTNGGPLTMRLSNSGIIVSINPAPSVTGPLLATPFASNNVVTTLAAFPSVWLNEVQADNVTGPFDNFSQREPWAELRNNGGSTLNLGGYYLSDTYTNLTKWAFPSNTMVSANGFNLVWCDNQTNQSAVNVPHAAFRPASGNGQIILSRAVSNTVQIVDYLNYTSLAANWSYGDVPDGQPFFRDSMFFVTPGGTNNGASAPITVFINEWVADNTHTLADPADGNFEDWFELYNPGTNVVDLGGYFLTDNLTNKFQFQVPNNGHYLIPPGGYLLVWADNEADQNNTNTADLHASFALGKGGEAIGLFAADGTTVDAVVFGAQTSDNSEGRFPNGAANVYSMPTPTPRTGNIVPNTSPTLAAISNRVVTLGQTLSFTASASDADLPPQTLTFSLSGAPFGAGINSSSGLFSWKPGSAPSTNTIHVIVTDTGTPNLSATQPFTVIVVLPPKVTSYAWTGNQFVFSWPTLPGQRFQVEYKDDLNDSVWTQLGGPLTATGASLTATNIFDGSPERFFRLQVLP